MSSIRRTKNRNKPGSKVIGVETPGDDIVMQPLSFHDSSRRGNTKTEQSSCFFPPPHPYRNKTSSATQLADIPHAEHNESMKVTSRLDDGRHKGKSKTPTEIPDRPPQSSTNKAMEQIEHRIPEAYTPLPLSKIKNASRKRKAIMPIQNPYAKKTYKKSVASDAAFPRKLAFESGISDKISKLTQTNSTIQSGYTNTTSTQNSPTKNNRSNSTALTINPYLKKTSAGSWLSASTSTPKLTTKVQPKSTGADDWTPDETLDDSILSQLIDKVESEQDSKPYISNGKIPPLTRRRLVLPDDLDEETVNAISQKVPSNQRIEHANTPNRPKVATIPTKTPVRNPYVQNKSTPTTNPLMDSSDHLICSPPHLTRKSLFPNIVETVGDNKCSQDSEGKASIESPKASAKPFSLRTPVRNPYLKRMAAPVTDSPIQKNKPRKQEGTEDLFADDVIDDSTLLDLMEKLESQKKVARIASVPGNINSSQKPVDKMMPAKRLDFEKVQSQSLTKILLTERYQLEDYINKAYLDLRTNNDLCIEPRRNSRDPLCERINFLQLNGDFPDSFIGAMHTLRELGNQVKRNNTLPRRDEIQTSIQSYKVEKSAFEGRSWFLVN